MNIIASLTKMVLDHGSRSIEDHSGAAIIGAVAGTGVALIAGAAIIPGIVIGACAAALLEEATEKK